MHEVLVNRLVKLVQECVVRRTVRPDMTIAAGWDAKHQNNQSLLKIHCKQLSVSG